MTTQFKCPDCEDSILSLDEEAQVHTCPDCEIEMTVEDAEAAFEDGNLIVAVIEDDDSEGDDLSEETEFNGFANRETWAANLTIQNNYKLFKEARKALEADGEEAVLAGVTSFVESNSKSFGELALDAIDYGELVAELTDTDEEVAAISEELAVALEGSEELNEEQRSSIKQIFESALQVASNRMRLRIEEETAERFDEQLAQATDELNEQADAYLTSVAAEWFAENKIAIESGLKVEKTEQFLEGLHQLFADHYIEVPEDRFDVLADLAQKVDELTEAVATAKAETLAVKADLVSEGKKDIVAALAKDLADSDVERLNDLAESVDYESDEQFTAALKKLKEAMIDSKNSGTKKTTQLREEEGDGNDDDSRSRESDNPMIAAAAKMLSRK
jgi:hypothetical protein